MDQYIVNLYDEATSGGGGALLKLFDVDENDMVPKEDNVVNIGSASSRVKTVHTEALGCDGIQANDTDVQLRNHLVPLNNTIKLGDSATPFATVGALAGNFSSLNSLNAQPIQVGKWMQMPLDQGFIWHSYSDHSYLHSDGSNIFVRGGIEPELESSNLGNATKKWSNVYATNLHSNSVEPELTSSNLGTSSKKWNNVYATNLHSNSIEPYSHLASDIGTSSKMYNYVYTKNIGHEHQPIHAHNSLLPGADDTYSLGQTSLRWSGVYMRHLYPTGGELTISGGIKPQADSYFDLGSSDYKWDNLHTSIVHSDSVLPATDQVGNLGSSTKRWANVHTFGVGDSGSSLFVHNSFLPSSSNTFSCGNFTYHWANVYTRMVTAPNTDLIIGGTGAIPFSDGNLSLGSSSKRWNEVYCKNAWIVDTEPEFRMYDNSEQNGIKWQMVVSSTGISTGYLHVLQSNSTYQCARYNKDVFAFTATPVPVSNGGNNLGESGRAWHTLYLSSSNNIASDARLKTNVTDIDPAVALQFVNACQPKQYQLANGTSGRLHCGLIAQEVKSLLDTGVLGGNASNHGVWTEGEDKPNEENDPFYINKPQSLRYGELIPLLIGAVNKLTERVTVLEAMLAQP